MAAGTDAVLDLHPKWMRYLLDLPFVGVAIFDARRRKWVRFNERFCATVGYSRRELSRMSWRDLCHPGDRDGCEEAFQRLNSRTHHMRRVYRFVRKDGQVVHAEIDFSLARAAARPEDFVIALVSDVAAHRSSMSEAGYGKVFGEGQTALVVLDAETWGIVDANPAAQSFYGLSLDDLRRRGLRIWDISQTDSRKIRERLQMAADGQVARLEGTHRIASGELREVEVYCGPVSVGGKRCVYGMVHDVSERKRAEAEHRAAEEKLRAVVEQTITGFYMIEGGRFSYVNPRMAEIFGYSVAEMTGMAAIDVAAPEDRALVSENIRRRIDGEADSAQYEFHGLRKDGTRIDVGAHGSATVIHGRRAIVGLAQDITERRKSKKRIKEYVRRLESAMVGTVDSISRMVDLRDPYTSGHERRVAEIAAEIGRGLGLDGERVRGLQMAGRLHDIGKISVPAEILSKPTRLTKMEYEIVKLHACHGHEILEGVEFPWPIAQTAHQHHERMDGSGYPHGLKGEAIIPEARILAVADVIEAMASHRPYRASLGIAPALVEIERGAGKTYDGDVAAAALRLFRVQDYQLPE